MSTTKQLNKKYKYTVNVIKCTMSKYIKAINRRIEQKSKNGPYFDLTILSRDKEISNTFN